jgi:hypothetical protein
MLDLTLSECLYKVRLIQDGIVDGVASDWTRVGASAICCAVVPGFQRVLFRVIDTIVQQSSQNARCRQMCVWCVRSTEKVYGLH